MQHRPDTCPLCADADEVEQRVLDAARTGDWADFWPDVPFTEDPIADEIRPESVRYHPGNTISAGFLRCLLTSGEGHVHPKGVRIRGARITGLLDLEALVGLPQLTLRGCRLDEAPVLEQAEIEWLELSQSAAPGLDADQLHVTYNLVLTGSALPAGIRLNQARIDGALMLEQAQLGTAGARPGSNVLIAHAIEVASVATLDEVTTWGALLLTGGRLGGSLRVRDATLNSPGKTALRADRISIAGNLHLDRTTASGTVGFRGAQIGGDLYCRGTSLRDPLRSGPEDKQGGTDRAEPLWEAKVLVADQAEVGGDVHLTADPDQHRVFSSSGCVSFIGTTVKGSLLVQDATLSAVEPQGKESRSILAFDGEGMHVHNRLTWKCASPDGLVDLRYARVHRLDDDITSWPRDHKLHLAGLVYEELRGGFASDDERKQRLDWLRSQHEYASQPYEQLARFYRNSGHLRHGRYVGIARENARLAHLEESKQGTSDWGARRTRLFGAVHRLSVGFGYRPHRALGWFVVLFLLAFLPLVITPLVDGSGARPVAPSKASEDTDLVRAPAAVSATELAARQPSANRCDQSYPCYSPTLYGVETVVPLINLRQGEYWVIKGDSLWGKGLRVWLGVLTIAGWVLATFTASSVFIARR
jgi:hypothetical protein